MRPNAPLAAPPIARAVNGTFELPALPGENHIQHGIVASGGDFKWVFHGRGPITIKVGDGKPTDVSIPVEKLATQAKRDGASQGAGNSPAAAGDKANDGVSELRLKAAMQLLIDRKYREALPAYSAILRDQPNHVDALLNRAEAWRQLGEYAKAADDYETLVKLNPPFPRNLVVYNNFAYLLAAAPDDQLRNGKRAVELAERANQLHGTPSPDTLDTLAAAYAEAGQFDRAIETQQQAIQLAPIARFFGSVCSSIKAANHCGQTRLKLVSARQKNQLARPKRRRKTARLLRSACR